MRVTKEGIERIKVANDLAAVVAERGIALKRKGKALVALCPFHQEKTPSFTITPSKGLFHCFGCGFSGDVIRFVSRHDKVTFSEALTKLSKRAGLELDRVMQEEPRCLAAPPALAFKERATSPAAKSQGNGSRLVNTAELLGRVVEHYHRSFCEREDAQAYLKKRGLVGPELLRAFKVGYADGSLLKVIAKEGGARDELLALGVITAEGRELLGGCIVVPIPDPLTGQWTNLYGRGMKVQRHCYLPGPLRGVLNFQAARLCSEVILTESILDALSFHQAGITNAIPIYGANGFTADHLDLLKRESVKQVVLALDNDDAGRKATASIQEKLTAAGILIRVASFPTGVKDANDLLVSCDGDAGEAFRKVLAAAEQQAAAPKPSPSTGETATASARIARQDGQLVLRTDDLTYQFRAYPALLGRLRTTVKVERGGRFHVDTIDLYSSRSRTEFSRRVSKLLVCELQSVEEALLSLLVEAEKTAEQEPREVEASVRPVMTEADRAEALALLKDPDLLDQVARDLDTLGYVGEEVNKRLLYLVAISRKLPDPLSAVILSQSGAGKSGLTEVIERLTPPEDVVLLTRLTPQSLYYVAPGFLDQKLVIVEERYGSMEADYSIRVLQSRKKLIAAAPIKDPQTGNLRTKVFTVEARAAFIEATTASSLNYENATRCFELAMDESVEQTRRVHERQRLLRTAAGLRLRQQADATVRRHWNAQRLLEPLPVVIPYADRLTFPSTWMRTRRDHARFLNLIEVSAFLHQHQRERQDGAIVASMADYAVAYGLAGQVLTETLSDLKKPLREAFERVRSLCLEREGPVSRREIREALQMPDSTVRNWLSELVSLEYLEIDSGGPGKAIRYRLTERGPREELVLGLLMPSELEAQLGSTSQPRKTSQVALAGSNF